MNEEVITRRPSLPLDYAPAPERHVWRRVMVVAAVTVPALVAGVAAYALTQLRYTAVGYAQIVVIDRQRGDLRGPNLSQTELQAVQQACEQLAASAEFRDSTERLIGGFDKTHVAAAMRTLMITANPESRLVKVAVTHRNAALAQRTVNAAIDELVNSVKSAVVAPIQRPPMPRRGTRNILPAVATAAVTAVGSIFVLVLRRSRSQAEAKA